MVRVNIKSVIAGIHRTKVGSHPRIQLLVETDDSIPGIDQENMGNEGEDYFTNTDR